MDSAERQRRELANNDRTVELWPVLSHERNREVFGMQDLGDIPKRVRLRLQALMNGHVPIARQAWQAMSAGNFDEAQRLFEACLQDGANFADDRFFSVHWGLGDIALRQGDQQAALRAFQVALQSYNSRARESHYLQYIELFLVLYPAQESAAAAIACHGLRAIGCWNEGKPLAQGHTGPGAELYRLYCSLELHRTGESRPGPIGVLAGRPGINRVATNVLQEGLN